MYVCIEIIISLQITISFYRNKYTGTKSTKSGGDRITIFFYS